MQHMPFNVLLMQQDFAPAHAEALNYCWATTQTSVLLRRSVLIIQSTWRMLKYRRAFLRQRRAAVAIQARVKGMQARTAYAQLQQRHAAATALQAAFRGHKMRQEYLLQRDAAIAVQMGFRRRQVSRTHLYAAPT